MKFVDPNGLYNLVNTCAEDDRKCNKKFVLAPVRKSSRTAGLDGSQRD
jgi:hypothetical protein